MTPDRPRSSCLAAISLMILTFAARETAAQPAPGTPDLGFGVDGETTWPSTVGSAGATDVAVDASGRIVVVGYHADFSGDENFVILRYLPNGQLDASFGQDGVVTAPIGASDDRAMAVAITPDGKILVAGMAHNPLGPPPHLAVFALARYLPDGSPDTGFGAQGTVVTVLSGHSYASGMALQPDGKIVVAGVTDNPGTGLDPCVIRYQPNGLVDTGFGSGGVVVLTLNGDQGIADVALTGSGRILLVGHVEGGRLLVRLQSNGELDDTFGDGGLEVVTTQMSAYNGLVVQPDGKIVVPGAWFGPGSMEMVAVARRLSTGSADVGFAGDGAANPIYAGEALDAVVQPDGKIVVAGVGRSWTYDYWYRFLWRLNPDGTPDSGFQAHVPPPPSADPPPSLLTLTAVTLQPDGKIVAAGTVGDPPWGIQVVRYHGDALDLIFRDGFESGVPSWSSAHGRTARTSARPAHRHRDRTRSRTTKKAKNA